jgi:hypothetical protein
MSKYQDLQKEAASLGIKAVGVSKAELEENIKIARAIDSINGTPTEPETEKAIEVPEDTNTAIVLDKMNQEVRRYTIDIHGDQFVDLAYQFAKDRGNKVVFTNTRGDIECPKCGHRFNAK